MSRWTVLFDLDGTLADTAPDLCGTLNVILEREGRAPVPHEEVRGLVGGGARVLLERGFEATGAPADTATLDRLFPAFIEHYEANIANASAPFPGVLQALEQLRAQEALLGVCTNKMESLSRRLLGEIGLAPYFPVIVGGDTLPVKKPDPRHLTAAVEQLGGAAERTVMIGDSEADVGAAKAAGIPCVLVSFGYRRAPLEELEAEAVIDHFDELIPAIERLLAP